MGRIGLSKLGFEKKREEEIKYLSIFNLQESKIVSRDFKKFVIETNRNKQIPTIFGKYYNKKTYTNVQQTSKGVSNNEKKS